MKQKRDPAQISMTEEIIVDLFAGGGGASTGIEMATGRVVSVAVNHNPEAILLHQTNHPYTEHYQEDVWVVDPKTVCKGRPVGLLWASPDCFVAGTLVLTQSGYKPIEDVQIGELVLTHKNRWRPVIEKMESVKPVMRVKGYGHPGIVCSFGHPFYIAGKNRGPEFKTAEAIDPCSDYWGVPIIEQNVPQFNANHGIAWIAGRYVGDGWLRQDGKHNETVITCGKQDIEFLERTLPEKSGRKWNFREVRTGGQFTACDKTLTDYLDYNFGRLSHNKHIPTWLFSECNSIKEAFLDGYVSADGHRNGSLIETSTVSKKLAFGLVTLLASMGKPATVYFTEQSNSVIEGREVNSRPVWKVKWRDEIDEAHKQTFERDGIIWRPIRETEDLDRFATVYNIGVEEDESYVAEGIIVHNCRHFSKAKGAALVDRKIRGLAWVILRWAGTVRPRVILMENVEEFVTWGPVRKGKPVKKLQGKTFEKFISQFRALGYEVEWKELVAADYGAPTSRKRFVLCARCDGRPVVWPERTHAPLDSEEVKSGDCKPWRAAAEIIDWSLPMYSIFDSKAEIKQKYGVNAVRPLAENTMRRIICGTDKYTIKNERPFFLIPTGYGERDGQAPRTHDPDKPLSTVVSTVKQNLAAPIVAPFIHQGKFQNAPQSAEKPLTTITSVGAHELAAANLVSYHADENGKARVNDLSGLLPTVDSSNRFGLTTAQLVEYYGNGVPVNINDPMRTVTSHDREGLLACHLDKYFGGGYSGVGNDLDDPLTTITHEPRHSMVAAHVAEFKGKDKGQGAFEPLRTITAGGGEFGAVKTVIERYDTAKDLGYWPHVRALLNKYCGYKLAENEVLLLIVGGVPFYIRDILLRMLAPRELYNAMGFPPDYIIDHDCRGNEYKKTSQVARCGNAVCPPMAEAVVRANLPEWCGGKIETMDQFKRIVSA